MKPANRALQKEIGLSLAIVFGLTFALALVQLAIPALAGYMQVGLAVVLLQVPTSMLKRFGVDERAIGLAFGPLGRALRAAGLTVLVVFPVFVLGFHLVHTQLLGYHADWDPAHLARFDEALEGPPADVCDRARADAVAWVGGDKLWFVPPAGARLEVRLELSPPPQGVRAVSCAAGRGAEARQLFTGDLARGTPLPPGVGLLVPLGGADRFALQVREGGRDLPAARLRLGKDGAEADDDGVVAGSRSAWWLLTYVIVHLGLVALPEEWFFRGYLQTRLDTLLGRPRRLLGADVGWGLVLAALAFALLHPILLPGFHRLLVFFPALLFGWLRARTGAIGASVLVHALSNVLLAVVSRMYFG